MESNLKAIKEGKYIGLYKNLTNGTYEIWKICDKRERWDWDITDRDEAREVWGYAEKHYRDGL